jgi:hypothetical protein
VPESSYPAARAAAGPIHDHFARHGADLAPDAIAGMIEAAFWASLRREEGYMPRISLAYVDPAIVRYPLRFERPLPLAAQPLTQLGPAVERPGIHLGVWPGVDARLHGDPNKSPDLAVWGATRVLPPLALVIEVVAPGLLVVKHSRGEAEKFVNVAVLQGDQVKIVDERSARLPDCPSLLTSLLGFDVRSASGDSVSPLVQLAISMRAHGRGGSLLVVPAGAGAWLESVVHPIAYALDPPFSALADFVRDAITGDPLRRAVDGVAGLTAVDGATVLTDRYDVLAFGAKIVRRHADLVPDVILTEPIEGNAAVVVEPGQLGGTRHLSAAQFVYDQRDSVALVASQDGHFTVLAWSQCDNRVHAHRIESLLL